MAIWKSEKTPSAGCIGEGKLLSFLRNSNQKVTWWKTVKYCFAVFLLFWTFDIPISIGGHIVQWFELVCLRFLLWCIDMPLIQGLYPLWWLRTSKAWKMLLQSDRSIPNQFCLLKFYRPIGKDFCLLIESALIALSDQELSRAFRRFKVSVKYSFRAVDIFFLVVDSQSIIQIKRETVTAFMNYFTWRYIG